MPELPEVEVTRRELQTIWEGQKIVSVWTSRPNYFFVTPPGVLKKRLEGRRTLALRRHGKYILASLDDGSELLCHLGMTGRITAERITRDQHVHLILKLTRGQITFRDVRKFGKVEWIAQGASSPRLDKLGPDALDMLPAAFQAALAGRRAPIKATLLSQNVLAGVGNIYADEALFGARIGPQRPSASLSPVEARRLLKVVRALLVRAIASGGSTINDYLKPSGELGGFQDFHRVYGKAGEHCPRCRGEIVRHVLAGRSTHHCPSCQR
jgi:formamidopyrimidine-DNA glycosylase